MNFTIWQLMFFFLVYSFLGWCSETVIYTFFRKRLVNPGFLFLPFILTYGFTMLILCIVLPTLGKNQLQQFVMTLILASLADNVCSFVARCAAPGIVLPHHTGLFGGRLKGIAAALAIALAYFLTHQIIQPLFLTLSAFTELLSVRIILSALFVFILADLLTIIVASRRGSYEALRSASRSAKLSVRLNERIWKRIQKSYPGIQDSAEANGDKTFVFGKGLNIDKVVWVFFICALLGDLIETCYCGLVNGEWMNRSSVLYGPFSFVWGIGAALLTIALLPVSKKNDRWVFMGGFVIGGAFEYLCSVFTELVFGTVFWDYSYMPLNIGGRTNVLFCFFWGILSVIWVKMIYPHLSDLIEKIPPVTGKIITWALVTVMLLNAVLTMMAMIRFNVRRVDPVAYNQYDAFLDTQYPDEVITRHWPNMIVVDKQPDAPAASPDGQGT